MKILYQLFHHLHLLRSPEPRRVLPKWLALELPERERLRSLILTRNLLLNPKSQELLGRQRLLRSLVLKMSKLTSLILLKCLQFGQINANLCATHCDGFMVPINPLHTQTMVWHMASCVTRKLVSGTSLTLRLSYPECMY